MANSLSKKISVFPISFDRSQEDGYTYYERNTTPPSSTLEETQKSFLEDNPVISEALYNSESWTKDYYSKIQVNGKDGHPNGRILSEKNISTLIRSLTDKESFVVNADIPKDGDNAYKICNYIEFVIRGRYFGLNLIKNTIPNSDNLWVKVIFKDSYKLDDDADSDEYETLDAEDIAKDSGNDNSLFVLDKVTFTSSAPTEPSNSLQLLEKLDDGTLRVPIASQFKFTSRSIENINGGTV